MSSIDNLFNISKIAGGNKIKMVIKKYRAP